MSSQKIANTPKTNQVSVLGRHAVSIGLLDLHFTELPTEILGPHTQYIQNLKFARFLFRSEYCRCLKRPRRARVVTVASGCGGKTGTTCRRCYRPKYRALERRKRYRHTPHEYSTGWPAREKRTPKNRGRICHICHKAACGALPG